MAAMDSDEGKGKVISAYIRFDSKDLTKELIYINVDSIMSGKWKTDKFSFKIK